MMSRAIFLIIAPLYIVRGHGQILFFDSPDNTTHSFDFKPSLIAGPGASRCYAKKLRSIAGLDRQLEPIMSRRIWDPGI